MNDQRDNSSEQHGADGGKLIPASARAMPARPGYGTGYGDYAGDPGTGAEPGLFAQALQYWQIIKKRKWLILSIAAAFLVLGAVRTLMQTPLYTASVRLQIDRNVTKVVNDHDSAPLVDSGDMEFMRTQYELLQSRAIAERVASTLKLGDDPDFFKPRDFSPLRTLTGLFAASTSATGGKSERANLEHAAAGVLLGNRAIRPVSGSRLVDITYTDPEPGRAQRIASAYADAAIAANLDKRFQANAYAKTFLEDQIKQLKLRLEESERVLLDFAQREQIVAVTEKSNLAESNLSAAYATLGSLASERIKNEQLWKQLESASALNLPQLLTNNVIDGLRARRNALVTEYQEKLETFQPSYPAMIQIDNKIKEIDRQIAAEVKTIKASYKAAFESSSNQENEMKKHVDVLKGEVLDLQNRSIQYNILKREVDTNRSLYEGLLQRYKEVDIASGAVANNIFVVERADLPDAPSSPQLSRALMLSLALGLGAGLGAALLLERFDDTVKSSEDLERITGLPTLGIIPKLSPQENMEAELADPRSPILEAYRSLCTSLQFSTETGLPKTLFITSASAGDGKSTTSLTIATHFARLGLKVLLVDADLRNASLHEKLGRSNTIGLSNYLTGACSPPDALQTTAVPTLAFMASGPLPPNAADLLGGSRLLSLFSVGLEVFDLIVIDGPPVLGLADAPLLSNVAAATILIVRQGETRIGALRHAIKQLQLARSSLIGAVLAGFDVKTGYGYGYGYGYGEEYRRHEKALPSVSPTPGESNRPELTTTQREAG